MVTIKMNASGKTIDLKTDAHSVVIEMKNPADHTTGPVEIAMRPETARTLAANLIEMAEQCEARRV